MFINNLERDELSPTCKSVYTTNWRVIPPQSWNTDGFYSMKHIDNFLEQTKY